MINASIFNLFKDTTDEPVLGSFTMNEEILNIEKSPKSKSAKDEKKKDKYRKVKKCPLITEITFTLLEPTSLDQILTD